MDQFRRWLGEEIEETAGLVREGVVLAQRGGDFRAIAAPFRSLRQELEENRCLRGRLRALRQMRESAAVCRDHPVLFQGQGCEDFSGAAPVSIRAAKGLVVIASFFGRGPDTDPTFTQGP
ncbi:hypothetical protein [Streptomyces sp. NBC_01515]|uniref:hypothetical protein n=1 Tax=Streptomyces sp. NBC_01515 TaxID=2903890 RepID=UPI0038658866